MIVCEPPEIRARLTQALAHHKAGRLALAEALYQAVLDDAADHPEALHFLGVIAYQRGEPVAAVGLIERAIEKTPERADFHCNLGNALKDAGRTEDAVAAYRRCLDLQPGHSHAWSNLGVALHRLGRLDQAIAAYQDALRINPQNAQAQNNLGAALQDDENLDAAIEAFKRALSLQPGYAEAQNNLGTALHRTGDLDAAEGAFRRALGLAPNATESANNLGNVLLDKHDFTGALGAYENAARLDPKDPHVGTNLAIALSTQGRFAEARQALQAALAIAPGLPRTLSAMGRLDWAEGEGEAAQHWFRRALAIDPRCFDAQYHLAITLYDDQDLAPAAKAFEAALSIDSDHPATRFYLGTILDCLGRPQEAARHFDAVARHPKGFDFLLDSWDYIKSERSSTARRFSCGRKTLEFALEHAELQGLVLEFGVLHGSSINYLAARCDQEIHGFDSFEGLPEAWGLNQAGAYSTGGVRPKVADNVRLHAGWFEDSLPEFTRSHPGPVRFMNVDCDLYSSTRTVLDHLADRIVPGTVIAFDEYLCTARWREDEHRAFQEVVQHNGWRYRYLAHNLFSKQSAVIMTG